MDKVLERLKTEFSSEEARYAYADAVTNAFLTAQIKTLREERGLTQDELAELVGTQQSGISRWLNSGFSACKVETLRKFARAYGVRLRITFEEFGSLPDDVRGFTEKRLAPHKFEDDPAFKEAAHAELEKVTASEASSPAIGANDSSALLNAAYEKIQALYRDEAVYNALVASMADAYRTGSIMEPHAGTLKWLAEQRAIPYPPATAPKEAKEPPMRENVVSIDARAAYRQRVQMEESVPKGAYAQSKRPA